MIDLTQIIHPIESIIGIAWKTLGMTPGDEVIDRRLPEVMPICESQHQEA